MSGQLYDFIENFDKVLHDKSKPWEPLLATAEQYTGVGRLKLILGFTGFWLVFGYGAQLICNLIGFIYPAYQSVRAIESRNKDDDTKWLIYWVVFTFFTTFEYFANLIVGWCPVYWLMKCVFMIWLMLPVDFNGSLFLYRELVRPYFLKYHSTIDDTLEKVRDEVMDFLDKDDLLYNSLDTRHRVKEN